MRLFLFFILMLTINKFHFTHSMEDQKKPLRILIEAGAYERNGAVVSFNLPIAMAPDIYVLADKTGKETVMQVDELNRGWFVLDHLPAGASTILTLKSEQADPQNAISLMDRKNDVVATKEVATISFSNKAGAVLSYYHDKNDPPDELDSAFKRGGYIHPLFSPSGAILTHHLNPDHQPHHFGIWSAWRNTRFQDRTPSFWDIKAQTGRVDVDSLVRVWEGPVLGGFLTSHYHTDLTATNPTVALNEIWEVRVFNSPYGEAFHIIDLEITQTVNTNSPLFLPEYRYGGIGFRGHIDWNDAANCFFLTADGLGRDGHATRSRWAFMGGYSDGTLAGFAVLGHPSNYRFPEPMRIHPREPFFNFAPTQLGDMSIQPGIPHIIRYRIVTQDGKPDPVLIERIWYDYAYPPNVSIIYPGMQQ